MNTIKKFVASHERVYVAVFWMCLIQLSAILFSIWLGSQQGAELDAFRSRVDRLEKKMQALQQEPSRM